MAEIHLLPSGFNPIELNRNIALITQALEAGHDFGDRTRHIQAVGQAMEELLNQMRHKLKDIREMPAMNDHPSVVKFLSQLERFALDIEAIAEFARNYKSRIVAQQDVESLM